MNKYYRVEKYGELGLVFGNKIFIDKWLRDEHKKTYHEILFNPSKGLEYRSGDNQYLIKNLFTGFKYEEDRVEWQGGSVEPFLFLVRGLFVKEKAI